MKEREPLIVSGLMLLMLLLWLGFLFHQSPRFAGTLAGGILALSGSVLILVPALYSLIKRNKNINKLVTKHLPMRTLLAWHIYAGVLGPILVILHTGHKFHSPLGVALTAMVIVVVISGFIGRYLMTIIAKDIKEQQSMLKEANEDFDLTLEKLRSSQISPEIITPFRSAIARLFLAPDTSVATQEPALRTIRLAETIADLEYSLKTHELAKSAFGKWLKLHIFLSIILYVLLFAHVWSAVYFGIRWFE
jgi:hypothetical protein